LPKVPTWRLERETNPRPSGWKSSSQPRRHRIPAFLRRERVPQYFAKAHVKIYGLEGTVQCGNGKGRYPALLRRERVPQYFAKVHVRSRLAFSIVCNYLTLVLTINYNNFNIFSHGTVPSIILLQKTIFAHIIISWWTEKQNITDIWLCIMKNITIRWHNKII